MEAIKHYILTDGKITEVPLMEWAEWIENHENKVIEQTDVKDGGRVSTVFLGLDHNFSEDGPPILFETMYFSDYPDMAGEEMDRYTTIGNAKKGHWDMVKAYGGRASG